MRVGDLVRLSDDQGDLFTVGSVDMRTFGWFVPQGKIALVVKIIPDRGDGITCHVLVDGKIGWIYEEDCKAVNETR